MGAISGMGDTYDLPNFVGELFNITPSDTPLLSMMGGMTGGVSTKSKQFTWQTVDNATAAQTVAVEGAAQLMLLEPEVKCKRYTNYAIWC